MQMNKCYRALDDYCLVVDRWPGKRIPILQCKKHGLTSPTAAEIRAARRAPQSKCPRSWLKKRR
jgi:valyl-tRNA synthetase